MAYLIVKYEPEHGDKEFKLEFLNCSASKIGSDSVLPAEQLVEIVKLAGWVPMGLADDINWDSRYGGPYDMLVHDWIKQYIHFDMVVDHRHKTKLTEGARHIPAFITLKVIEICRLEWGSCAGSNQERLLHIGDQLELLRNRLLSRMGERE